MHDFEIGVFKMVFAHLIRILYSVGPEKVHELNKRQAFPKVPHCSMLMWDAQVPSHSNIWSRYNPKVCRGCIRYEKDVGNTL